MWQGFDWGWGMGLHMLLWWALVAAGLSAVGALLFALGRNAKDNDSSTAGRGPKL